MQVQELPDHEVGSFHVLHLTLITAVRMPHLVLSHLRKVVLCFLLRLIYVNTPLDLSTPTSSPKPWHHRLIINSPTILSSRR